VAGGDPAPNGIPAANGVPAAGAKVRVRSDEIEFADGVPGSKVLDSAIADARGAFSLRAPKTGTFHLEIDCAASQGCAAGGVRSVYGAIYYDLPAGKTFGELHLLKPGSIAGSLVDTLADPAHPVWVGIAGTGLFVRALADSAAAPPGRATGSPAPLAFRLEGVFPGEYILELIRETDSTSNAMRMKTDPLKVESGGVADAGAIRF
jgi:hypothetical protein